MKFNQIKYLSPKVPSKDLLDRLRKFAGTILFLGLATAVAALFFFGWLAEEVFEGNMKAFDETVRNYVHGFSNSFLTMLMQVFTILGSTLFLSGLGICVFVIFIRKDRVRAAILFVTTIIGAILLNYTLKTSFARPRPVPFFETPLPSSYSFPSGHALFAVCFYSVLAWLITARTRNLSLQILTWMAAVSLIFLIGLSRIYLGVHYPSDVLAGYAAATVWVMTVAIVDSMLIKRKNSFRKQNLKL